MTSPLTIRQFESADADPVISLWEAELPSAQPWNDPRYVICRKRHRNDKLFFVGEQDGRIVGTVIAGYDGIRGWIYSMAVARDLRRQGIGRRLLEAAETALAAEGCAKINLQVRADNSEVIEFYERCGFAVEDRASLGKPLPGDPRSVADPVPTIVIDDEIRLSQITWDDKPALLKHLNGSPIFREHVMHPFPYTDIDADQWLSRAVRDSIKTGGQSRRWAIRSADDELIGVIGLFTLVPSEKGELGYWLAEAYWGRGIMTAVARRVCEFAFDEYDLRRIFAHTSGTNRRSARVLEKAGFELEGTLRNHDFLDGTATDVLCFGLLRPE